MDAQEHRCRAYCTYRDIPEDEIVILSDGGFSGGNIDRPAFQEFLKDCSNGVYERLIIYKLDRISRSIADFSKLLEFFIQNNIEIVSVSENLDLSTSVGALIAKILVVFAEYERELDIERTNEAIIAMIKQKLYPFGGRKLALGYKKENKKLVVDEREKPIYNDLKETFFKTKSLNQTYVDMLLKYPKEHWSVAKVTQALKNPIYLGGLMFKDEWYPDTHEPLLTQKEYDKIQKLMKEQSRERKHIYLYKGLVYCSKCNSLMICRCAYNKNGHLYLYYTCTHCHRSISEIKVSEQIKFVDLAIQSNPIIVQDIKKEYQTKLNQLQRQYTTLTTKQNEMIEAYMHDELTKSQYIEVCKKIDKDKAPIKKEINKINRDIKLRSEETFKGSSDTNKYLLIHKAVDKIYWDFTSQRIQKIIYQKDKDTDS